jgi:hypothetical protein
MRRLVAFVVLLALLGLGTVGCQSQRVPPNSSPQTVLAVYAGDVMKSVHLIQDMVIKLEGPPPLGVPTAAVAKSVDACGKTAKIGLQLADALTAYQAAVDAIGQAAAAEKVNATLDALEASLKLVLDPITVTEGRKQIADLILEVTKTIWLLRATVPVPLKGEPLPTTFLLLPNAA